MPASIRTNTAFKVAHGSVLRRFNVEAGQSLTWNTLEQRIRALHSLTGPILVTYTDEDGDEIALDSDTELEELLNHSNPAQPATFKFRVRLRGLETSSSLGGESRISSARSSIMAADAMDSWHLLGTGGELPPPEVGSAAEQLRSAADRLARITGNPLLPDEVQSSSNSPAGATMTEKVDQEAPVPWSNGLMSDLELSQMHGPTEVIEEGPEADKTEEPSEAGSQNSEVPSLKGIESEGERAETDREHHTESSDRDERANDAQSSQNTSDGANLGAEIHRLTEQVRQMLAAHPEVVAQVNSAVEQIQTVMTSNFELVFSQLQTALQSPQMQNVFRTAQEASSNAMRGATDAAEISRRAYEDARAAAEAGRRAWEQRRQQSAAQGQHRQSATSQGSQNAQSQGAASDAATQQPDAPAPRDPNRNASGYHVIPGFCRAQYLHPATFPHNQQDQSLTSQVPQSQQRQLGTFQILRGQQDQSGTFQTQQGQTAAFQAFTQEPAAPQPAWNESIFSIPPVPIEAGAPSVGAEGPRWFAGRGGRGN
ncbi:hypothetical protein HK104_003641, partial [Borealophlyctis nickersoniae]